MSTYLDIVVGRRRQKTAITASAGAADAAKLVATGPDGRFDASLMPAGFGEDAMMITASEALSAGDVVNIHDVTGSPRVRKADAAAAGKEADGFVTGAVSSGQQARVYFEGRITGKTGLTIGGRYYLATTPGSVTATAPSGSGNVVQYIGRAISATEITFEPEDGDILA